MASKYLKTLQRLFPRGRAWPTHEKATMTKILDALSCELQRLEDRSQALLNVEGFPDTAVETIEDWERVVGLPGVCEDLSEDISDRQAAVVARLSFRGGSSIAFFTELAATLGFPETAFAIEEFRPFKATSMCTDGLYQGDWIFVWRVTRPDIDQTALLDCLFQLYKPAHTLVLFQEGTFGYGGAYGEAFGV